MPKVTRKRPALKDTKAKTVNPKASKAKLKASSSKAKVQPAPVKTNKRDAKVQKKEEDKIEQRSLVMSNGAAVDHLVPNLSKHEVVMHNGVVLNCNLMFAD